MAAKKSKVVVRRPARMFEDGRLFNDKQAKEAQESRAKVADKGMMKEMGKAFKARSEGAKSAKDVYSEDKYVGDRVTAPDTRDHELITLDSSDPAAPKERDTSVPTITDYMRFKNSEGGLK